ncbi:MAG: hypothetical protein HKM89_03550 [Gemmatimonadales bacterium]|nr:hypothetical protein [Gemmatimonadales bacterium]
MHGREQLGPSQTVGWSLAGFAAGLVAGIILGEWFGPTTPRRLAQPRVGTARRGPPPTAAGAAARAQAALATDPGLAALSTRPIGPRTVEVTGWVDDRAARARAARLVNRLPGIDTLINSVLVRGEDDQRRFPDLRLTDQSA